MKAQTRTHTHAHRRLHGPARPRTNVYQQQRARADLRRAVIGSRTTQNKGLIIKVTNDSTGFYRFHWDHLHEFHIAA